VSLKLDISHDNSYFSLFYHIFSLVITIVSLLAIRIFTIRIFSDLKLNLNVKNTRCKTRNIFNVSRSLTVKSGKRLSIYLSQLINKVIRYSHYLEFKDFKQYILFNISDLFLEFDLNFLHINC
jgi:hypothetical protein